MIYYLRTGSRADCQYLSRRIEAEDDDEAMVAALVTIALYPDRYYALYDGDWEKVAYYSPDGCVPSGRPAKDN